jgi:pimeloyl-ACP methyl ester carboxylesterase
MTARSIYKSEAGQQAVLAFYNQALAYWPVEHQDLLLKTRLGETFVIASGPPSGVPLILLHGAGSNALAWMGDVPALSRDFRVYSVDIPGDPGRSAPVRPSWNGSGYVEWLEDVLNSLKINRAGLIGLSQGGWLALKFAVQQPDRVARLVVLSPAGVVTDRFSFLFKAVLYSLAGKKGVQALTRLTFGKMTIAPAAVQFQELILTHFRSRIEKVTLFTAPELARLNMPVLLIGGQQDVIRDVEKIRRRLSASVPGLQSRLHPDQGHVLINQSTVILPFLQQP